jgi:3',5'-cyclic AMP phosphodiesterase CpdA
MSMIVQISDLHVSDPDSPSDRIVRQADRLARAVAWINRLQPQPDLVLASGDLVDQCRRSEYERLKAVLADLEAPIRLMVGNHDDRDHLRAVFDDHGYLPDGPFVHYTVDHLDVRVIALDSQIPGEIGGELCARRLAWLEARLAEETSKPTIVALHHPPFPGGIEKMDAHSLIRGGAALESLLARSGQVVRVVAGHVHRPFTAMFGGRLAMTCPSTSHQIAFDIERQDGVAIMDEPAQALLHLYRPASGLVTHLLPIGDHPVIVDVRLD